MFGINLHFVRSASHELYGLWPCGLCVCLLSDDLHAGRKDVSAFLRAREVVDDDDSTAGVVEGASDTDDDAGTQ